MHIFQLRMFNMGNHDLSSMLRKQLLQLDETFLRMVAQPLRKFPALMEPEDSLPCSQERATGPLH
jgi:hypothetical protein